MLSKKIEEALNKQIESESMSSQLYLAMASWAEGQGYSGTAEFLYTHADEERMHMLKLLRYINERSGHGIVPALKQPPKTFSSISEVFNQILKHEVAVSSEINSLVEACLTDKDYATNNFLQWYVSEQIEEERLAKTVVDKLNLIGNDKGGLYLFDRDLAGLSAGEAEGKK
ncbi:MAG TPA: ferritin [Bacteroidia bacterium]|jgi:ferritin|nr:ferritin [Bacteroidia bacterium]